MPVGRGLIFWMCVRYFIYRVFFYCSLLIYILIGRLRQCRVVYTNHDVRVVHRAEKEKQQMKVELDDIRTQLEHSAKTRASRLLTYLNTYLLAATSAVLYCLQ